MGSPSGLSLTARAGFQLPSASMSRLGESFSPGIEAQIRLRGDLQHPALHVQHDSFPGLGDSGRPRLHAIPDASAIAQTGSNLEPAKRGQFLPALSSDVWCLSFGRNREWVASGRLA
jgi:hypothetical protein